MRVRFMASDKPREQALARAFAAGARAHGVETEIVRLGTFPPFGDLTACCMVGVKSRAIFKACQQAGVVPIMFDKGYIRDRRADGRVWEYWRVSVNDHHPTDELLRLRLPPDRMEQQFVHADLPLREWRAEGEHIILAGSSAKYHAFYGLPDPTNWARTIVKQLREITSRPIIYRPKPSWRDAVPITKTQFSDSRDKLPGLLADAWAVVTHGSNISFEAAIAGVPSIVLGNGIGRVIGSTSISDIVDPLLGDREPWLRNLCYFQWTEDEISDGRMWEFIAPLIERARAA